MLLEVPQKFRGIFHNIGKKHLNMVSPSPSIIWMLRRSTLSEYCAPRNIVDTFLAADYPMLPEQKNRMMASVPASVMSLPGYVTTSGSSTRLSEHSALCTAVPSKCKIICKCEFHGRKHILATITKVLIFYLHFKLHFRFKRDFRRCMLVCAWESTSNSAISFEPTKNCSVGFGMGIFHFLCRDNGILLPMKWSSELT